MKLFKIIVDSASDIPKDLREKNGIICIPFSIIFGQEQFKDQENLSMEDFYKKIKETGSIPKTAQVTAAEFRPVMEELLKEAGTEIIVLPLAKTLSGTYGEALKAMEEIGSDKIHVIDTKAATCGLGAMVLEVAKMAAEGKSWSEIEARIEDIKAKQEGLVYLDTMEFLRKGGRITFAQAMIGGMLNIKPILMLKNDGVLAPFEKAKGKKQAIKKIVEHVKANRNQGNTLCISHGLNEALALEVKEALEEGLNEVVEYVWCMGGVIGTHAGPGAVFINY